MGIFILRFFIGWRILVVLIRRFFFRGEFCWDGGGERVFTVWIWICWFLVRDWLVISWVWICWCGMCFFGIFVVWICWVVCICCIWIWVVCSCEGLGFCRVGVWMEGVVGCGVWFWICIWIWMGCLVGWWTVSCGESCWVEICCGDCCICICICSNKIY